MNAKAVLIIAVEAFHNAQKLARSGALPKKAADDLVLAAAEAVWKIRARVLDVSDIPFFDFYEDKAA
jgi:hypothetical protein